MPEPTSEKEYILFCDESDKKGRYYSNFYGGVRVPASRLQLLEAALLAKKSELGITSEIKWEKVGPGVVERYEHFLALFFSEIASGHAFMRVMFTQNANVATGLTQEHHDNAYYLLYYQFLKHGFGLGDIPFHSAKPRLRIYLDEIGDTREQVSQFKGYLQGLANIPSVRAAGGIILEPSAITEIRSHDHVVMQALDVVLGSITFRLNDKHLEKPEGQAQRGKRTIAKERLYKFILKQIQSVSGKTGFNVGTTTGLSTPPVTRWDAPYLHWVFTPKNHVRDHSKHKP